MALYGIYTPLTQDANHVSPEQLAKSVAVKDRFSVWAFAMPIFWMVSKAIWVPLCLYISALFLLLTFTYVLFGAYDFLAPFMMINFFINLFIGLEAHAIVGFGLRQKGFAQVALLRAVDKEEAIMRYFDKATNS